MLCLRAVSYFFFFSRALTMNHAHCICVGLVVETIAGGKEIQPPAKK